MYIGIINRYTEGIIDYEEVIKGINADFFVISTEMNSAYLHKIFGEVIIVDSFDDYSVIEEIIISKNKKRKIDVLVASHEFDLEPVANIREKLGIDGQSKESAKSYRNKLQMCRLLKDVVKVPLFEEINSVADIYRFAASIGYPIVIKPIDGAGSVGFTLIENSDDIEALAERTLVFPMIAQEYILGEMCHVDGLYDGERVIVSQPSKYINGCLAYRENKYVASVNLEKNSYLYDVLNNETKKVLNTLPSPHHVFPFHAEFFVDKDQKPIFCEIASRVGGGFINDTTFNKLGINLLVEGIKSQCIKDYKVNVPPESENYYGFMLIPPKNGVLEYIAPSVSFKYVVVYKAHISSIGQYFYGGNSCVSEIAKFLVKGNSEKEMTEYFEELNCWAEENIKWGKKSVFSMFN